MSPESIQQLTPGALRAMDEIDPATATAFVEKLVVKAGGAAAVMQNLYASGLLGTPGQPWNAEIRNRVKWFVERGWSDSDFKLTDTFKSMIGEWLGVVQPTAEDRAYLLFTVESGDWSLQNFFIGAGADPHLPIVKSLDNKNSRGNETYAAKLVGASSAETIAPQLKKLLATPNDDLPLSWVSLDTKKSASKTLLDIALGMGKYAAARALLDARDLSAPKVTKAMTDSLARAIKHEKHCLALRLLGVGAEPDNGNWQPVVNFFATPAPGSSIPRILTDFSTEASDAASAAGGSFTVALQRLAQHGMDLNVKNGQGESMVYLASHYGHLHILEVLLDLGADFRDVLASYDAKKPSVTNTVREEEGRQMLLAHAARQAMSGIVKQARAALE
jgi:hypothetical protein